MNENMNELEIYKKIKEHGVIKIWSVDDPTQIFYILYYNCCSKVAVVTFKYCNFGKKVFF